MKRILITYFPLILIYLGASILMWMEFGWMWGMVLPIIALISWGITEWISYWEEKTE